MALKPRPPAPPQVIRQPSPSKGVIRQQRRVGLNAKSKSSGSGQSEDPVAVGLARARKAWEEYQANAVYDRDAVYAYLQVVFDVVQEWEKIGMANEYSLQALKQHDFPIRLKPDPYARLIYCSSEVDDAKQRSKWANVMQWVANRNKKGEPFADFVKRHGGLNECAHSESLDHPRTRHQSGR